ncbi:FxsA family protein [Yangia mangrovi]|uniref:Exlusion protein FxsA n=1 Tax=Alloyangia mangrovi TaxID=1779329 RepID=A0A2A3JWS5_9RHOB|nr:FxsA family protein [Alloyangia mangrovi]MCA0940262.1 FxsA family protein [Alloyangia pacifica]MCA0945341.1 FxsA family protein [Alloyangia pacifica]MCT4369754.1 FxsA family protein [Alloyangia mangrovi]
MWLFLAFVAVPLIEITLFIQVGGLIGLWPTLLIVVMTAILGTALVRREGLRALSDLQSSFSQLQDPTRPLAHGAMILFSGALLLTPGFFTDACGFALLIPAVRDAAMRFVSSRIKVQRFEMGGRSQTGPRAQTEPYRPGPQAQDDVIEGEFTEIPGSKRPNHPGSGWTKH